MITLPLPSLHGLTTERLLFRTPAMTDAVWWMEYMDDAASIRFMPFTVGSEADCAAFIQRSLDRIARDGSGLNAIVERVSGRPVGMVGLLTQEVDGNGELEVGYHLVPSATGKGYATEAAMACKEFAQTHRLAPSVISLIDPGNGASQAVALRNGMHLEGMGLHRGDEVLVFRAWLDGPR
jgi:[ribosomal protein S5]-alanine N-acetyltransferase